MAYRDLVKQAATVNGTGPFTFGAAVSGFQTMNAGRVVGDLVDYAFRLGTDWEVGVGTIATSGALTRTPSASSNGGLLVNFSTGTGEIVETATAASLNSFASVRDIPFATVIPLTRPGAAYMADKTVNGPLTFTAAAGAVRGTLVYLTMIADGVNLPNFLAFKEWGGSSGYDNRNGIENQVQFFYDGRNLFYSASQAVGATPIAAPDTTAPTLTSPTGSPTGSTTASGSVTTNEANGTLYYLFSTSSTASAAVVKAGSTQAVTSTGSKAVSTTGLTASTTYYVHFLHRDAAGNDSAVASSASFQTSAAGDTTAPTLSAPTATKTGSTTASGSVTTNEANGTLYYMASVNATETAATVKAGASQAVTATGPQAVSFTGLPAASTLYGHYLHRDAAGNDSTVANTGSFVTDAAAAPANYPRLTDLVALAESGTDPYTYTGTGGSFSNTIGGVSVKSLPANTDGTWDYKITAANEIIAGFTIGSTLTAWGNWKFGLYAQAGSGATPSAYRRIYLGANQVNAAGLTPAAGDIQRFSRVGNVLKIQLARAATPTVFLDMETFDYGAAPQMWIQLLCSNTAAVQLLAQTGFV